MRFSQKSNKFSKEGLITFFFMMELHKQDHGGDLFVDSYAHNGFIYAWKI